MSYPRDCVIRRSFHALFVRRFFFLGFLNKKGQVRKGWINESTLTRGYSRDNAPWLYLPRFHGNAVMNFRARHLRALLPMLIHAALPRVIESKIGRLMSNYSDASESLQGCLDFNHFGKVIYGKWNWVEERIFLLTLALLTCWMSNLSIPVSLSA